MSTQPLLEIRVQRKSFASTTVLKNVSLALQPREAVSLLGPSGCGKSTLLRIVAGLETDFQGELRSPEGEVAFVFQEPRLMPWLTVEQNIGLSDDNHPLPAASRCRVAPAGWWRKNRCRCVCQKPISAF